MTKINTTSNTHLNVRKVTHDEVSRRNPPILHDGESLEVGVSFMDTLQRKDLTDAERAQIVTLSYEAYDRRIQNAWRS